MRIRKQWSCGVVPGTATRERLQACRDDGVFSFSFVESVEWNLWTRRPMALRYFFLIGLFERHRGEREREGSSIASFNPPNAYSSQSRARSRPGAQNSALAFPGVAGIQHLNRHLLLLRVSTSRKLVWKQRSWAANLPSHQGCRCPQAHLNCCAKHPPCTESLSPRGKRLTGAAIPISFMEVV